MNSRVKTLSGAKPFVFSGKVAPGVAGVGSLFPQVLPYLGKLSTKKAHRTVAKARFALQNVKSLSGSEHF